MVFPSDSDKVGPVDLRCDVGSGLLTPPTLEVPLPSWQLLEQGIAIGTFGAPKISGLANRAHDLHFFNNY